jgi:hypothetical protein
MIYRRHQLVGPLQRQRVQRQYKIPLAGTTLGSQPDVMVTPLAVPKIRTAKA